MLCSTCNEYIRRDDSTAIGPDGVSHARCAKLATAHGKELDIFTLSDEIDRLKRRVQELERTVENHGRNIDFRIG